MYIKNTPQYDEMRKKRNSWHKKGFKDKKYYYSDKRIKAYLKRFYVRYWIFWPMMRWFAELPDVQLSKQFFYQRFYQKQWYERHKHLILESKRIRHRFKKLKKKGYKFMPREFSIYDKSLLEGLKDYKNYDKQV